MFQEAGSIGIIVPDNDDIFAVAVGGSLGVVETANLDMLTINDNIFVMMDFVAGNSAEWNTGIHQRVHCRIAFVFGVCFLVDDNFHINPTFFRINQAFG